MGMFYLAALAAAKKRQEASIAAARRERMRREEEEKQKQSNSSIEYNGSKRKIDEKNSNLPNFFDCVSYELNDDEELSAFFQQLLLKIHEIRNRDLKEIRERAENCIEQIKAIYNEMNEIKERINRPRFVISGSRGFQSDAEVNLEDFLSEFCDSNKRNRENTLYVDIYYHLHYVIKNAPEIYEDRDEADYYSRCARIEDVVKAIRGETDGFEDKKRWELQDLVYRMSPEEKKDIIRFYELSQKLKDSVSELASIKQEFDSCKVELGDKELMLQAMQLLEEDGTISEEEITRIFRKLDRIAIARARGEYDEQKEKNKQIHGLVIRSFVRHVYEEDPTFVDRNLAEIVDIDDGHEEL